MKRSDTAMSRDLDGEVVILDIPSGNYFALNEVGALVWDQLEDDTDRETLVTAVTGAFDVDVETAATDIDALLEQLTEAGLILDAS